MWGSTRALQHVRCSDCSGLSRMIRFHLCLTALSLYVLPAYGTATRYAIFNDTNCTQEIYTGLDYRPIVETKTDGTQVLGNFGQCHVYEELRGSQNSTRIFCQSSSGGIVRGSFSTDTCCSTILSTSSTVELSSCSSSAISWYSTGCDSPPQDVASIASSKAFECDLDDYDGPSVISSEAIVNYNATEYYDLNCTDPTGESVVISSVLVDEVAMAINYPVSEYITTFSTQRLTFGITGTGAYCKGASECRPNGTLVSQYNAIESKTCSDEVAMETFISNEFIAFAYKSRCSQLEIDGLYYRPIACTTEDATVGADATYSPTPTPAPEVEATVGADATYSPTPTPAPEVEGILDHNAGIIFGRNVVVLGMASTSCAFVALAIGVVW